MSEKAIEMKEEMSQGTMGMKGNEIVNGAEGKMADQGQQDKTMNATITRMELEYSLARPS